MTLLTLILLFLAGVGAGVMNTVGGGGSVLTLPALIFLGGLSSTAANATNRIGIISQNIMALFQFRKGGIKEDRTALRLVAVGLVGAVPGAWFASSIPEDKFDKILGVLMLALLGLILSRPKANLVQEGADPDPWVALSARKKALTVFVYFWIGLYAGLIQAGAGIMILAALGHMMRIDLVRGNYIKLMFILVLNVVAFAIFCLGGVEIAWAAGIMLFFGQVVGAYIGSWVALKKGEGWITAILIVCIVLSSGELLGVNDWILGLFRGGGG